MLPLVFLPGTPTLLAGQGAALARRQALLDGAGFTAVTIHEGPPPLALLDGMRLVFGAGLAPDESEALAAAARARGIAVNIEDVPALCDMHVPAVVRRGGLAISISTGGAVPALASLLRARLEQLFGAVKTIARTLGPAVVIEPEGGHAGRAMDPDALDQAAAQAL